MCAYTSSPDWWVHPLFIDEHSGTYSDSSRGLLLFPHVTGTERAGGGSDKQTGGARSCAYPTRAVRQTRDGWPAERRGKAGNFGGEDRSLG